MRARVLGVAGEVLKEDAAAWRVYVTGAAAQGQVLDVLANARRVWLRSDLHAGHSLGGALATLCAYELANRRCAGINLLLFGELRRVTRAILLPCMLLRNNCACGCRYRCGGKPRLTMYNFGSPRVGNAAFAKAYNAAAAVPDSWRVTNKLDVIPRVPRLLGYCHVGNSASITPDGAFELNGARAGPSALKEWIFYLLPASPMSAQQGCHAHASV